MLQRAYEVRTRKNSDVEPERGLNGETLHDSGFQPLCMSSLIFLVVPAFPIQQYYLQCQISNKEDGFMDNGIGRRRYDTITWPIKTKPKALAYFDIMTTMTFDATL